MKHLWSIYAGLLLVLGFGRMVQKIITDTGGIGSRYGPVLVAMIIALGVLGYVFQRPIARNWVWKGVFWLLAIASVGMGGVAVYLLFSVGPGSYNVVGLLMGLLVVLLPGQWQLFGYAYRSSSLWSMASEPRVSGFARFRVVPPRGQRRRSV